MSSDHTELSPAPTTENVVDLGLQAEFERLEELTDALLENAFGEGLPDELVHDLSSAHLSIRHFADPLKGGQCDFLAGFLRERVVECDGYLHDAEAELGGRDGRIRDARQLCWAIAEELPDGRKEGRGRVSRCARCFEITINSTPNTLPCPGCERGDQA
jgi:hypothetical protein